MKKRILALVMAGVMALSLAACGGNSDPKSSTTVTADSDFKVGAIYINKKTDTAGYTYAHHKGITTAMDELGLDSDSQLVIVDEVPEEDDKVAAGLARRCQIELAYAIGVARPVSVLVETFGTGVVSDEKLEEAVEKVFDLRPTAIIRDLDLRRPIYRQLAAYGHMGREDLGVRWEATDRVAALKAALNG